MKSSPLSVLSFLAVMLFSLAACNSSDSTNSTNSKDSAGKNSNTPETTVPTTPTNTIITTPQAMLTVRHRVKDFDTWKLGYEANDSARLANGLHNYVIGRGAEDPNIVLVALKADDMNKAKAFASSPALKQIMQKAGVLGVPTIQFTTNTFQDTVTIGTTLRSMTMFKVKDWATWEKNFKDGEQERIDNGITIRVYGHDADDNNKVRLVTAITDTAKAYAYWKSDMLKKRRAAGGVIGEPERFVFNIVKRY